MFSVCSIRNDSKDKELVLGEIQFKKYSDICFFSIYLSISSVYNYTRIAFTKEQLCKKDRFGNVFVDYPVS